MAFSRTCTKGFFYGFDFLFDNVVILNLLGKIVSYKAVVVLVGAAFPTVVGLGKVIATSQRYAHRRIPGKFRAIVAGERVDAVFTGFKQLDE